MYYDSLCAQSIQIMNKRQRITSSRKNKNLEVTQLINMQNNSRYLVKSDNRSTSIINRSISTTKTKVKPFILEQNKPQVPIINKAEIQKDLKALYQINSNFDILVSNLSSNIQYKQLEKYDEGAQHPRDRLAKLERLVLIESIQRILSENRSLFVKLIEKHKQRVDCKKIHQFIKPIKWEYLQQNNITKQQWLNLQNGLFCQFLRQKQQLSKLKDLISHYKQLQENLKLNSESLQRLDNSKYTQMHDLEKKLKKIKRKKQKIQIQNKEKLAQLQSLQKNIIRAERMSAQLQNQQTDMQNDINYKKNKLKKIDKSLAKKQVSLSKSVPKKQ